MFRAAVPPIRSPIWLTEEYAMRDFMSVWRMQTKEAISPPISLIVAITIRGSGIGSIK